MEGKGDVCIQKNDAVAHNIVNSTDDRVVKKVVEERLYPACWDREDRRRSKGDRSSNEHN